MSPYIFSIMSALALFAGNYLVEGWLWNVIRFGGIITSCNLVCEASHKFRQLPLTRPFIQVFRPFRSRFHCCRIIHSSGSFHSPRRISLANERGNHPISPFIPRSLRQDSVSLHNAVPTKDIHITTLSRRKSDFPISSHYISWMGTNKLAGGRATTQHFH